jgi:hypothetical protein
MPPTPGAAALLEELTLLLPKVESLWQKKPFSPLPQLDA